MKESRKHRILSAIGAVSCVISMILSVTVLPAIAYANVTKNPLFAAALSAVIENNRGQNKSGEGGAKGGFGNSAANGEAGKEVKGDKAKGVDKKEGNRAAKGEAGNDSERVDNKGSKGNSENPNGGGSVDNSKAGKDAGKTAGKGAGNDANGENKKANVPAKTSEHKSKEKGEQADKNKKDNEAKNKNAKEKDKKKVKGKDRSTGAMEKLNLEQVKKLPACEAYLFTDAFTNASVRFRPSSGSGNKCAISADAPISNFDSIRQEISNLGDSGSVNFSNAYVYAYGSLSKNDVGLFSGKNISNIDNIEKFDISNVTDMSYLFKDSSLTDLNFLSGWDVSKVTNMEGMFEGCTGLSDISGLTNWNVSKVTNMKSMFSAVIKNETQRESFDKAGYVDTMAIDSLEPLSNWNVSKVTNMDSMFEGCTKIESFKDLGGWKTRSLESMNSMFRYCLNIGGDDQSSKAFENWDVSKVTGMRAMFAATQIQNTVGLKKWNVSNVIAMDDMFARCTNLDNIEELANWNKDKSSTSKLTSTFRMFYECNNISSIEPLKDWDVSNVENMHDMFNSCSGLTSLSDLAKWKVDKVTDMHGMFHGCSGLTSLEPLSNWATKVGNVKDMHDMFNGCSGLSDLSGLKNWDVNNVKNMSGMFSSCANDGADPEKGFDISALSNWATKVGNVTDMSGMFTGCESLKSLSDLAKWKVDKVTDMHGMFNSCIGLTSLEPLSNWATKVANVTDMHDMFNSCTGLTSLEPLSNWNVSNVTNMSSMFNSCQSLTGDADLSKWDISKVTNLSSMFSGVGAESGNKLVLDFSNKTFTKSKTPLANDNPDDTSKHYFSVDGMFDGFKGTLIANGWSSSGFGGDDGDNPIAKHFAGGEIFSKNDNDSSKSDNIVVTNNVTILNTISKNDKLKKIEYYIPVKAKLMEPGEMGSCKCGSSGDSGGTTYTYYVSALYDSTNTTKGDESLQEYAYRVVKNSFASKFRSAIDSQSGEGNADPDNPPDSNTNPELRSARLKSRVKRLQSIKKSQSVRDSENEEEQGNTYKIWFKKPSEGGCTWTELGEGENGAVPVSEPKSPLTFFNTMYYLETFVKPVPLPHTGGQSAVMFTFLSIGLFSMFAVAGAFGRHGWVASVLPSFALATFGKHTKQR